MNVYFFHFRQFGGDKVLKNVLNSTDEVFELASQAISGAPSFGTVAKNNAIVGGIVYTAFFAKEIAPACKNYWYGVINTEEFFITVGNSFLANFAGFAGSTALGTAFGFLGGLLLGPIGTNVIGSFTC